MVPSKSLRKMPVVKSSLAPRCEEVEFTWIIQDFMTQYAIIKSATQGFGNNEISDVRFSLKDHSWRFCLRQSGNEDVGIYLDSQNWKGYERQASAMFEAKILNGCEQVEVVAKAMPHTLFKRPEVKASRPEEEQQQRKDSGQGIEKFTTLSELQCGGFLSGGNLEIELKASFHKVMTTSAYVPSTSEIMEKWKKLYSLYTMKGDFVKRLESGESSDVTLVLKEELQPQEGETAVTAPKLIELKAHKCILGARSPVFAAMFESDMKEKSSNRVVIEEVSAKAMKLLLKMIYTGYVAQWQEWGEVVDELIYAADKYQLIPLKDFLNANIAVVFTPQNILKLRKTLQLHELTLGLQAADKYIRENLNLVLDSN